MFRFVFISIAKPVTVRSHPEVFIISRTQAIFLLQQTFTAVVLNGIFSALAVFLAFRYMTIVPLSGHPSLIVDSIYQTFTATFMSILPPSILTAKWMLSRRDLTTAKTTTARILPHALSTAFAVCLISFMVYRWPCRY